MTEKLKLYNTLSRKKEIFKPIKDYHVGIYTCGPTVYWYQHIGNLRSYVFPDILKKTLIAQGYEVNHVINVTDVGHLTSDADSGEDKMEKAAKREGKNTKEISDYYFKIFKDDLKKINVSMPNVWPKATEHIKEQIEMIKKLEKKGFTYRTSEAIYFDVSKFKDYTKLSGQNLEEKEVGIRKEVVIDKEKRNPQDFALWFFTVGHFKDHIMRWESPWGVGFPGWHIECSAMSMKYLGESFDIHTGGEDHISVHHTNEIAQSEATTGKKFVKYWLHGAFLNFKGEKVSKSKGGLYTLLQLEEKGYSPTDLKYFYLSAHYRKPLNFSFEALNNSKNSLQRLREIISKLDKKQKVNKRNVELALKQFMIFLNDDLNMPRALSYMWEILREIRLSGSEKYELMMKFDEIFGLNLGKEGKIKFPQEVKKLVQEREKFRREKKFKEADKIREKINKLGFVVEDNEKGAVVKKK